ncbi:hypothetical protein LL972_03765, partial [Xanthomonas campestris pv. asclepiadis]|uniref:hypothetical protein n=1 Tax=Xanthomonas campestris TaxID=339 RepID=UPI001E3A45CC
STPKLPESEQIRLWRGIHAAQGPATVGRQGPSEIAGKVRLLAAARNANPMALSIRSRSAHTDVIGWNLQHSTVHAIGKANPPLLSCWCSHCMVYSRLG